MVWNVVLENSDQIVPLSPIPGAEVRSRATVRNKSLCINQTEHLSFVIVPKMRLKRIMSRIINKCVLNNCCKKMNFKQKNWNCSLMNMLIFILLYNRDQSFHHSWGSFVLKPLFKRAIWFRNTEIIFSNWSQEIGRCPFTFNFSVTNTSYEPWLLTICSWMRIVSCRIAFDFILWAISAPCDIFSLLKPAIFVDAFLEINAFS